MFFKKKKKQEVIPLPEVAIVPLTDWCKAKVNQLEKYDKYTPASWKGNKYAERLIQEWLEHGKIVLAVDFDDTIYGWKFKDFSANVMHSRAIHVIKMAQRVGCYISIWSACDADRFDEIRNYCSSHDVMVDSINENPIKLPYGNHRKMYYNHLLDDRAGLEQALDMLEYVCYRVLDARKTKTNNFDV